jgi:transaldolase
MKTKIFCDSADYKIIKKFAKSHLVQGFTTNPSLMRLAGAKNYENYAKKILTICSSKPISFEVFADNADQMIKQGLKIKKWGRNVYVKIPVTNSKGKFSGKAIRYLSHKNVKLNITAVYTTQQTRKIISNLNKNTKSIISIFAGRMSDVGKDPVPIFKECVKLTKKYNKIQILWASTREPYNFIQAKQIGCNIITMPTKIIEKVSKFGKSFQSLTIDTVKKFLIDSKESNFKL